MKMKVIPIVIGALGTVLTGLEKRRKEGKVSGKIGTIQTTDQLEYRQESWDLRILAATESSERPPANSCAKNLQEV